VSSRIEDLRDLARMLDEGKISQREYDIVKAELLEAPSEEWVAGRPSSVPVSTDEDSDAEAGPEDQESPVAPWLAWLRQLPTPYRAGLVGAVLVLVVGGFVATRSDAAGTVTAVPRSGTSVPAEAPAESLGLVLDELTEGWNQVEDPPRISGGITTSPEPGPLDSFLHRFNESALLAGAYDPATGYVHALMVSSSLHYEPVPNLFVHLCYLLHPGSSACLETFVEETRLFGRTAADLIGTDQAASWEFEGQDWQFEIADDVETIRVQGADPGP
jgi:hypothetical protein